MRGRYRTLLVLAAAAATVALGLWLALAPERDHPLSVETYRKITLGMTRAEVEAVVGGPPGAVGPPPKYLSGGVVEYEGHIGPHGFFVGPTAEWYGHRGRIVVGFDDGGRVKGKQYFGPANQPRSARPE